MSWSEISPELRVQLAAVCTPRELDLLKLRAAHPAAGRASLASMLGLSETRIRQLDRSVKRKVWAMLNPDEVPEA